MSSPDENHPLLPTGAHPTPSRKLGARRYVPSEKAKGKQRADPDSVLSDDEPSSPLDKGKGKASPEDDGVGRPVTIIFSNDDSHLQVWVEEGENVRHVKDKIRTLRPSVAGLQLKIIYAGRLLTDGILLLPWLRSLEERVKRHASGVSGAIRDVVDLAGTSAPGPAPEQEPAKINLHCNIGGPLEPSNVEEEDTSDAEVRPQRRGFDALLDAGLSPEDVAAMRRQFYESRGEEVPDGLDGDVSDEHARALEEQWIEGDLTPATATTTQEGMFASILHGFLIGFLFPLLPWFFFKDQPLPNFFDAEAEADQRARREEAAVRAEEERRAAIHATAMGLAPPPVVPDAPPIEGSEETASVSARVSNSPLVGGEVVSSVAFGKRTQIGIILGTLINLVFGALNYLG